MLTPLTYSWLGSKELITYGVGVSLMQMRNTKKARGRVAVGGAGSGQGFP